jgi:hypothetical protein
MQNFHCIKFANINTCYINKRALWAVFFVLSGFSFSVFAAGENEFNKGADFFNEGHYADAVKQFKNAETQGVKSAALYYNLASSYYKLGDYEKSREYFDKVRRYREMQYLAEYNLGLIALKQNDTKTAKKRFTAVKKNSTDEKLVSLSKKQLKEIRRLRKTKRTTKKWSVYLSAAFGYDGNVNFSPLGISAERSDSFSEFLVSADYLFSGNKKNGWSSDVFFYDKNYRKESLFDEYEYGAGIKKYLNIDQNWQTQYVLNIIKINYADEDYQTIAKIGARAKYSLSRNERIYLRYGYEDITSDNVIFDYLEGWRQKIRADYRLYNKKDVSRIYYELELNNRNDLKTSIGEFSYSPTRHTIRGKYTRVFNPKWHLTGDLAYRISDYPATANQDRNDNRIKAALYADYRFDRTFKLRAKVEHTDNSSTEDVFDYRRTVYTVGLNKLF